MGWKERAQKAHPGDNNRKGLVVAEEDIGLIGKRADVRTEGAREPGRRSRERPNNILIGWIFVNILQG